MATAFLVLKNRAFSKLAAAVNDSTTTFTVAAGEGANFPSTYPFHLTVEDEIVSVTNRSTDTLTVVRAQQSTSAATHPNKAYIALNITAKSVTDLNTAVNTIEATVIGGEVLLADDKHVHLGTDSDITMLSRSTILNANTALTGVLVGTPVAQAIAANSLMIANVTASGDIAMYVNKGGHSQMVFWADGSTGGTAIMAASGQSVDAYIAGTKVLDMSATGLDIIPSSAGAYALRIAGTAILTSGEQAIYINTPLETVATNGIWITLGSTVTSGDLSGIRSRVTGNAASAGANVRGAYLEAKGGASKYAAMLEGALIHADYSAGSVTVSGDVRGLTVQISQGSGLNAANLYGILLNMQTRGDETITTDDVGLMIRNEAVGGNGRTMDAALKIAELNMGGGTNGFTDDIIFHKTSHIRDEVGYLTIYGTAGYVRIGDAGTSSQGLTSEDDLLVTGKLEVDGMAFFDGGIDLSGLESSGAITIKPSGDNDDYFTFATVSGVPSLYGTGAYLRIGDAATTSHSLASEDDLMVAGKLEVDGVAYLDGGATLGASLDANSQALSNVRNIVFNVDDVTSFSRDDLDNFIAFRGSSDAAGFGARVFMSGKSYALPSSILLQTPDAAGTGDVTRVRFHGNADIASVTWTAALQIGLKLGGALDVAGQNLDNVAIIYGNSTYLRIGDANTTQHSLAADDDLMVTGKLEVGGITYLDGALYLADNLFIAESAGADADVAGFGQLWVKNTTPNELWFTDDAGSDKHLAVFDADTGEMIVISNQTATIETANTPHAFTGLSTGDVQDFSFVAGITGAITAYADYSGTVAGTVKATCVGHGLVTNDIITIRGTTNYNGIFQITRIDDDNFYFTDTWVADDGASDFEMGDYLLAGTGTTGEYDLEWNSSVSEGGGAGSIVLFCPMQNTTILTKASAKRKFANNDVGSISGGGHIAITVADRIWFTHQSDGTNDLTVNLMNLRLSRLA